MANKILLPSATLGIAVLSLAGILPGVIGQNDTLTMPFGSNTTSISSTNTTSALSMNATTLNATTGASLIMDNGTLDCKAIAKELGGVPVPNGPVCDVVVVRQSPQITGHNGMNMNQFTLMNSVLEFVAESENQTATAGAEFDINNTSIDSTNMTTFEQQSLNNTSESNGNNSATMKLPLLRSLIGTNNTSNSTLMGNTTIASGPRQVYVTGDFALLETEMNDVLASVKDNGWTVTGIHNHMINETPKTSFMHWEAHGDINQIVDQANEAFAKTSIKG